MRNIRLTLLVAALLLLCGPLAHGSTNAPSPTQAPPVRCFCAVSGTCGCGVCDCNPPAVAKGCQAIPVRHRGEWWCQAAGSWWVHRSGRWVRFEQPVVQTLYSPMMQTYSPLFGSSFGGACAGGG